MKTLKGMLNANGKRFAIVASRFNEQIVQALLAGCLDCLKRHGASEKDIIILYVPGAFEIPLAAKRMAEGNDAVITLGAVIRGNTPHFDYVAGQAASGIASIALECNTPVIFGVLTTDTFEQAQDRAGGKAGNKGWDAALAAIEMASIIKDEFEEA